MQSMHQTDLKSQDKLKACPTRLMVSSLEQAPQKRREVANRIVPLQQVLDFLVPDGQVRILRMLLGSVSARSGNFPEKIGCLVRCHVCALFYYSAPVSSSKSLPAINTHIIARCLHTKMRNIRASSCQGLDHQ